MEHPHDVCYFWRNHLDRPDEDQNEQRHLHYNPLRRLKRFFYLHQLVLTSKKRWFGARSPGGKGEIREYDHSNMRVRVSHHNML